MKEVFIFLLMIILVIGHGDEDVHFYCRVCGSLIANNSSIIEKKPENVDSTVELANQEDGVHIHYSSFESSKIWKDKKLTYFSTVDDVVQITPDKQVCSHFPGSHFSHLKCSHCGSQIGYFVEETVEEEEIESDDDESFEYEEEDVIELLNIDEDGIESQLKKVFLSQPAPTTTIGYWSYTYYHRKQLLQHHSKVKGNPQDSDLKWSLGEFDEKRSGMYGMDRESEIPVPFYSYYFVNGQMCDEIQSPRETEVRFEPCDNKNIATIRSVDEVSICRYLIRICVPSLKRNDGKYKRNGFYALSMDDVIPSSDKQLIEILNYDILGESVKN